MKIKIEGKTKPTTPRKAVKFNGGQWANCSPEFYDNTMVGGEYEISDIQENAQGFKTIIENDDPNNINAYSGYTAATSGIQRNGIPQTKSVPPNGDSEKMTKADWLAKERYVAKQAVMKSVLESPGLAAQIGSPDSAGFVSEATFAFKEMWKLFNEIN